MLELMNEVERVLEELEINYVKFSDIKEYALLNNLSEEFGKLKLVNNGSYCVRYKSHYIKVQCTFPIEAIERFKTFMEGEINHVQ